MSNASILEAIVVCYLDFVKVLLVFRFILKYEAAPGSIRKMCSLLMIPIILCWVSHSDIKSDFISIYFIPILFCSLCVYLYKINWKMALHFIILYLCICLIDVFGVTTLELINDNIGKPFLFDLAGSVITLLTIAGIAFVCRKYNSNSLQTTPTSLILLQFILLIIMAFIIGASINMLIDAQDKFYKRTFILLLCILGILILSIGFVLGNVIVENQQYRQLEKTNQQLFMMQIKHFEKIKQKNVEMQKYKHDIQSHITYLNYLLNQGNVSKALKYVESMKMNLSIWKQKYYSGNDVIDAILNEQSSIIESNNIYLEIKGQLPNNIRISNYDLCVIFSNVLNNAVENAIESQDSKYIKIKLGVFNDYINIAVINSTKNKNDLRTTKKDKDNHGFGIIILREYVKKMSGHLKILNRGNEFEINIIIRENIDTNIQQ